MTRTRERPLGNNLCTTVRDKYSGLGTVLLEYAKKSADIYNGLNLFAGLVGANSPDEVVESDAAKEITNAVKDLGWHTGPSGAHMWPHNTVHER